MEISVNRKRRLIPVILFGMIFLSACSSAATQEKSEPKQIEIENTFQEEYNKENLNEIEYEPFSKQVVKEIYGLIDEKSSGKSGELGLEKVSQLNKAEGNIWEYMLPYWDEINQDNFVNEEILPDGLPEDNSFCIIVMGYQLNPDGSMRDELIGRITTAKACAEKYEKAYVLVTGGGTASSNRSATEADMMAAWLIDNGIDKERVIIENKSMTSADNALYSYRILRDQYPEVSTAAIVTSEYHVPLGCLLFEYQFETAFQVYEDKKISVISNAAYLSGSSSYFGMEGQAYWLRALTDIQEKSE